MPDGGTVEEVQTHVVNNRTLRKAIEGKLIHPVLTVVAV